MTEPEPHRFGAPPAGPVHRRRRLVVATVAAALVAVPVMVAVRGTPDGTRLDDRPGRQALVPATAALVPAGRVLPTALEARVDRARAYPPVPVSQDGKAFRVDGLATNGLLIGGVGLNVDTWESDDDRVGVVPPGATAVRWLSGGEDKYWVRAAGVDVVGWAAQPRGTLEASDVMCAPAGYGREGVRLGETGEIGGVYADGGLLAWTGRHRMAWISRDCARPRVLGEGEVAGVSGPFVYLRGPEGEFRRHDLDSGKTSPLPWVSRRTSFFAAAGRTLVSVWEGKMTIHRGDYAPEVSSTVFPVIEGTVALTVGRRLAVYSVRGKVTDTAVIDLVTGARTDLRTDAFVAGDYLTWREGDHYLVAPVR